MNIDPVAGPPYSPELANVTGHGTDSTIINCSPISIPQRPPSSFSVFRPELRRPTLLPLPVPAQHSDSSIQTTLFPGKSSRSCPTPLHQPMLWLLIAKLTLAFFRSAVALPNLGRHQVMPIEDTELDSWCTQSPSRSSSVLLLQL